MKRREALLAKDQKRPAKTLYAWDFLIGVQDMTRQGVLRFCPTGTQAFLGNDSFAAPPVTTLRELEQVAWQLTHKRIRRSGCFAQMVNRSGGSGCFVGGGPSQGQLHRAGRFSLDRQISGARR